MTEQRRYRVLTPAGTCIEHGSAEISGYVGKDGYTRRYCLKCRRERNKARGVVRHHRDAPRCIRGHVKTPRTWRSYIGRRGTKLNQRYSKCLPCQYMLEKERERARDQRSAAA